MKLLYLALAILHAAAVLTPCPGEELGDFVASEQAAAAMHEPMATAHAHHGHGLGETEQAGISASCSCGCGSAPAAASAPNARIGYALFAAKPRLAASEGMTDTAIAPVSDRPTPLFSIDHVPISS